MPLTRPRELRFDAPRVHNRRRARINMRISVRPCLYIGAFSDGQHTPAKFAAGRLSHAARTHARTRDVRGDAIFSTFVSPFLLPSILHRPLLFLFFFFANSFLCNSPPIVSVPALPLGLLLSLSSVLREFSCGSAILKCRFPGIFARRAKRRK